MISLVSKRTSPLKRGPGGFRSILISPTQAFLLKHFDNRPDDTINAFQYVEIRKSEHHQSHTPQIGIALCIAKRCFFQVVLTAINLDDELRRFAVEM